MSSQEEDDEILLQLFHRLPTQFLLCGARFACRRWQKVLESEKAQQTLWQARAAMFEAHARAVAVKCAAQKVVFESHREAEKKHGTIFSPLDRCLHYFARLVLWQTQYRICGGWMADYYTSSAQMHRYWYAKHARVAKLGADVFNETDIDAALRTVETSRSAALQYALQSQKNIPSTPPV